jgi:hypothetical protein
VDILIPLVITGTAIAGEVYFLHPIITIARGATSAQVVVDIVDDDVNESGEFLQFEISTVAGGSVSEANDSDLNHRLDILNNDNSSLRIDLTWDAGDGTAGDVDMDLIVWKQDPVNPNVFHYVDQSSSIGNMFEDITLPGSEQDGVYGMTFQYWDGSSDDLTFNVTYEVIGTGSVDGQSSKTFTGHYTQANVNPTFVGRGILLAFPHPFIP